MYKSEEFFKKKILEFCNQESSNLNTHFWHFENKWPIEKDYSRGYPESGACHNQGCDVLVKLLLFWMHTKKRENMGLVLSCL
jgi:hypothetical protein